MKRIILPAALLMFAASHASAQRVNRAPNSVNTNAPRATALSAGGDSTASKAASSAPAPTRLDLMDNTKIINWPDGQRATPTGHEATSINGGYASLGRSKD